MILRLFFIAVLFSFFGMSQNGSSVFDKIEDVPIYPGCENIKNKRSCAQTKIQEHIIRNFRYPKEAQKKKIQGRVFVFICSLFYCSACYNTCVVNLR